MTFLEWKLSYFDSNSRSEVYKNEPVKYKSCIFCLVNINIQNQATDRNLSWISSDQYGKIYWRQNIKIYDSNISVYQDIGMNEYYFFNKIMILEIRSAIMWQLNHPILFADMLTVHALSMFEWNNVCSKVAAKVTAHSHWSKIYNNGDQ